MNQLTKAVFILGMLVTSSAIAKEQTKYGPIHRYSGKGVECPLAMNKGNAAKGSTAPASKESKTLDDVITTWESADRK